ncbi:VIR protein [Plasmodium vivax]|uniref:VIR protein n=1 Tax=Plasmodium vivax TaxID=5855 RepID=A0A1G4E6X0_PLAVI|nr:VIR protein [Plasmodium vivax]
MASNEEDIWYVQHHHYNRVIDAFNSAIKYDGYGEDPLNKTLQYMNDLKHNLKKDDYIIKHLFRLLSSSPPFQSDIKTNYCKYINMWLNEKHIEKHHHINGPDFNVFKTFLIKLNDVKFGNKHNSCENYIHHLDFDRFNKIRLLHGLYEAYNKINNLSEKKLKDTCSDIVLLDRNYHESIYDYYVNDKILFNKIEHIKKLILKIKEKYKSPCTNSLYFTTPQELIKHQEKEALKAKEEEELRNQKEEERRAHEEQLSNRNAEMLQQQAQLLRSKGESLQLPQSKTLQGTSLEKEVPPATDDSEDLSTPAMSGFRERTQMFQSFDWSGSPRESLFLQGHTPEGQHRYQTEENIIQGEEGYAQKDTRTTGTFLGSLGLPDSITGVLGQVDPIPVVGVSGGMGALFLLFRYTPVGTFFRGSRRMQRIPSRFDADYAGFMPVFQGYDDGYFPNPHINIAYGRE